MDGEAGQQPVASIGPLLRVYRLRIGGSLDAAAETLHIRPAFLHAIEEARYADLPGPAYASGFVRAYAEYLGLDSEAVVQRFRAETGRAKEPAELHFPMPASESASPQGSILLVGVLIAVCAYGAWYLGTSREGFLADFVAPLPDRFATLLDGPETGGEDGQKSGAVAVTDLETTADQQVERAPASQPSPSAIASVPPTSPPAETGTVAADPVADLIEETPVQRQAAAPAEADAEESAAAADPADPAAGAVPTSRRLLTTTAALSDDRADDGVPVGGEPSGSTGPDPATSEPGPAGGNGTGGSPTADVAAGNGVDAMAAEPPGPVTALTVPGDGGTSAAAADEAARVVIEASERSWVEIRDRVGNRVMSRLMAPGEVYEVPDDSGLRLTVGNAGGVAIRVDGSAVPSLGGPGVVRRNVPLEPERLQQANPSTY